jgi:hypothetical protein
LAGFPLYGRRLDKLLGRAGRFSTYSLSLSLFEEKLISFIYQPIRFVYQGGREVMLGNENTPLYPSLVGVK